ncbi:MAG: NAD-dependent succinate-semialdehyde dehydrogenase [Gammaproteobacteria bacterium]|nr:NAD-dependent succinate-semialdehyde dehydrogenase [Gammaproteobacteria bacterium]MCW8959560.1 NAD-dependent succinate-semialdehyde dehydrogenase [Gammaproteobacteria bacterium]MCW8973989.1 NAD-dependent succinate-semialdehyde dehydrogenase [Gammaproteobacteria bacterium]MCW8993841.1 NAD-dependent succinate-semialdehyde dehydrogenase [Gammaproteobacteria bacterium]
MAFTSLNPATGELLEAFATWSGDELGAVLNAVAEASPGWQATPLSDRCELMAGAAKVLRQRRDELARIITLEMGKLLKEARGEIDKCAWVCDYYAENGPAFLADELIETDASRSLVCYQPLGTVLAVMPWNFPFWQVFRFAAPALVAGNTGVLKHASNVPQCAQAIESVFREAGFPVDTFRTLMISASQVQGVIEDRRIHAVTLTGSEPAGRQVAATAGAALKKTVLELGGSDPFVVLEDADLELAVQQAVASRYLNAGQSCIAAKRFIVVEAIAEAFVERYREAVQALKPGDPLDEGTTLAPMARNDLRDELHRQVQESVAAGATLVTGGEPLPGKGAFYAPTLLDHVRPGQRAYSEELFGPVATVIRAVDEADAVRIANDSDFGLGSSVWSADSERGERVARRIEAGCSFVNGMVKSDPRLPFGGIKHSGYGRELARHGIREFVNAKTLWIR